MPPAAISIPDTKALLIVTPGGLPADRPLWVIRQAFTAAHLAYREEKPPFVRD
jgi:hypothetical protein